MAAACVVSYLLAGEAIGFAFAEDDGAEAAGDGTGNSRPAGETEAREEEELEEPLDDDDAEQPPPEDDQ